MEKGETRQVLRKAVRLIEHAISPDVRELDIAALHDLARAIQPTSRENILTTCAVALTMVNSKTTEYERVIIVKAIIALLPHSEQLVRIWLNPSPPNRNYECQFTLFCFLNEAQDIPAAKHLRDEIPALVGSYLANIDTSTANAAWMAGDLLGDHWNLDESIPILIEVALAGRFVAGREAALHGLSQAVTNTCRENRDKIKTTIESVSIGDRSQAVRSIAKLILQQYS